MKLWKSYEKWGGSESGQSLVELSVGLGLLCIIMLGVMEFGQIAYSSIEVSNAAKAGVQYGAQSQNHAADLTGIQTAAQAGAPNLTGLGSGVTSSHTCTCSNGDASTCSSGDCSTSQVIETVTVNVSYSMTPMIRLPGLGTTFTIARSAVQKCAE